MSDETVKRTVTLVLPKKVNDFFEAFAKLVDVPVEKMFEDELISVLSQFYSGGFYQRWQEFAVDHVKQIEEEVKKLYDC